jgi:putative membrane protein
MRVFGLRCSACGALTGEEDMASSGMGRATLVASLALGIGLVGAAPSAAPATAASSTTARAVATAAGTVAAPSGVPLQSSHSRRVARVDRAFLVVVHDANLNEIRAGQLALRRATDPRVRELARMFIKDHTAADRQVRLVAARLGVKLPSEPSAQTQLELALLRNFKRAAFNRAWVIQQLGAHARAIVLTEIELVLGRERPVLALATATAPVIQRHYNELRALACHYGIDAPTVAQLLATVHGKHGPADAAA